mmetsp:Transcript_16385/g.29603  ORF Transcript_16385/g.29603 Transcript_16385/m.29603 type:complete len:96 (+) Transcript_16385:1674-1961(+)
MVLSVSQAWEYHQTRNLVTEEKNASEMAGAGIVGRTWAPVRAALRKSPMTFGNPFHRFGATFVTLLVLSFLGTASIFFDICNELACLLLFFVLLF